MTLTEFICTEGIENGLGFHDIIITNGIFYQAIGLSGTHCT